MREGGLLSGGVGEGGVCVCVCVCVCEGVDVRCTTKSEGTIHTNDRIQPQHQGLQEKLKR
jgi:hypothetical protein